MNSSDPEIIVTLTRSQWEMVLKNEPMKQETYTPAGVAIFNTYQAIRRAVDDGGER